MQLRFDYGKRSVPKGLYDKCSIIHMDIVLYNTMLCCIFYDYIYIILLFILLSVPFVWILKWSSSVNSSFSKQPRHWKRLSSETKSKDKTCSKMKKTTWQKNRCVKTLHNNIEIMCEASTCFIYYLRFSKYFFVCLWCLFVHIVMVMIENGWDMVKIWLGYC